MKKLLFFLTFLCSASCFAQDVIVKKDGSTILSKVLEVNPTEVKYKKHSNPDGPTYTIGKAELMVINYANGDKDDFRSVKSIGQENAPVGDSPRFISKSADTRNAEILALYNRDYMPTAKAKKKEGKTHKYKGETYLRAGYFNICLFGVNSSSVMSNEDIEMVFVKDFRKNPNFGMEECVYNIQLKNKTNKTIYIDKGNCFRIENDGVFHCYYDATEQLSVTNGKASGGSLGLGSVAGVLGVGGKIGQLAGGINVGGNSNRSVTRSYALQRVIAIPPQGVRNLCVPNFVKTNGNKFKHETAEDAERFLVERKEGVPYGVVQRFDETSSPYTRKYIITYSTDENFSTYSSIDAEFYIREAIGISSYDYDFEHYGKKPEKYIEDINDYTVFGREVQESMLEYLGIK